MHPVTPTILYAGAYGSGVFGLQQMDYRIYPPLIQRRSSCQEVSDELDDFHEPGYNGCQATDQAKNVWLEVRKGSKV